MDYMKLLDMLNSGMLSKHLEEKILSHKSIISKIKKYFSNSTFVDYMFGIEGFVFVSDSKSIIRVNNLGSPLIYKDKYMSDLLNNEKTEERMIKKLVVDNFKIELLNETRINLFKIINTTMNTVKIGDYRYDRDLIKSVIEITGEYELIPVTNDDGFLLLYDCLGKLQGIILPIK